MKPAELKVVLAGEATIRNLRTVQTAGSRRNGVAFQAALPQPVDQHFADAIDELKTIEGEVKR